jgi:hypothetical protein
MELRRLRRSRSPGVARHIIVLHLTIACVLPLLNSECSNLLEQRTIQLRRVAWNTKSAQTLASSDSELGCTRDGDPTRKSCSDRSDVLMC